MAMALASPWKECKIYCFAVLRGEGFGRHQTERRFGIALAENFGNVRPIHVAAKVHAQVAFTVRLECFAHHDGAEVAATNSNVDNVLNGFARVSLPFAGANSFRKGLTVNAIP